MIKYFCDKCGKEIKENEELFTSLEEVGPFFTKQSLKHYDNECWRPMWLNTNQSHNEFRK